MIRRYYILPLRAGVHEDAVRDFIEVLGAADRYIPGLCDSSAGVDVASRTVVWENTFVDEASYAGPYMVHPFHIGAIDGFVMADSPTCLTQDIFTSRFQTDDAGQPLRRGIRRVLLLDLDGDEDGAALASIATQADGIEVSRFGADDVGWVSAKGRAFTHVWEQAFTDVEQLQRHLRTRDGVACSSIEGLTRLGIDVHALAVFTLPFALAPTEQQTPAPAEPDDVPVLHTITALLTPEDVDAYVALLEQLYDPFMAACGSPLVQRSRSVAAGFLLTEVSSTWHLDTLASYSDLRAKTYADPAWNQFVRDAMPLVRGGTRSFHRVV